ARRAPAPLPRHPLRAPRRGVQLQRGSHPRADPGRGAAPARRGRWRGGEHLLGDGPAGRPRLPGLRHGEGGAGALHPAGRHRPGATDPGERDRGRRGGHLRTGDRADQRGAPHPDGAGHPAAADRRRGGRRGHRALPGLAGRRVPHRQGDRGGRRQRTPGARTRPAGPGMTGRERLRVVQWATGNVGRNALAGILARPDLELAGVWVSNPAKVGRDAGELAGLGCEVGIRATGDAAELLALEPDCAVYTCLADTRLAEAVDDLARILRAGVNVVSSSPVFLQFPDALPVELTGPLRQAAAAGGASLCVNGIDPGFANDTLPLAVTGLWERIEQVRCPEILNYASYPQGTGRFGLLGFGPPPDGVPP